MADSPVPSADFEFVARILRDSGGLVLEPGKDYLIKARLMPVAQRHGLPSIDELLQRLRSSGNSQLRTEIVEAMVITETSFFRDVHPFETLRTVVLPQLIERRRSQRQLNIWCAASSSGQEPYSIAMLLRENFPELTAWRINLSATDISHDMLERSRAGRYSQLEVNRGLPSPLLHKWFQHESGDWHIKEEIRRAVNFSHVNLVQPWPNMPKWDVVALRNVLIYFHNDAKRSVLGRVARVLNEDGYLLLGGAETTLNLDDSFGPVENLKSGFYQLR